jgi:glycosyltransferase involved in cell wall biosynthesis
MKNKKTILHIITSLKIGGAETLLVDFLEHPSSGQVNHQVVFFHDGPNRQRLLKLGIPCYQIKGMLCMYDPIFFIRLYKLIKHINPDCIHSWLWSANIAARLVGKFLHIPLLNSFHLGVDLDGFLRNVIDRYTLRIPDRLIAVSQGVAVSLVEKFTIYKPERLKVIKNGIDPQEIITKSKKSLMQRKALGLNQDHYVIGSVGRWIARKNYTFLIELFAQLCERHSSVRLVLLGKGEKKKVLQDHVAQLGLQEKVLFIEGQPALGYYPIFDCFIQTSFKEGISIALLEAMSCSLPCIITEPSGLHEVIIDDHNGIIVPSYNHDDVCDALEKLMGNNQQAVTLGKNAYQTIETDFALSNMVEAYHQEYSQLINFKKQIEV